MPTVYRKADDDVVTLLTAVMQGQHRDLFDAGVLVGVVVASNPDGDAVKHGGYPAFATIKVVSAKDRVSKGTDAELLIDEGKWEDLRPGQRRALIDHELSHLKLKKSWRSTVVGPDGEPTGETELKFETDDLDRPKLKTVPGDWNAGDGFRVVVARHGADAIEFENLSRCKAAADAAKRAGERGEV